MNFQSELIDVANTSGKYQLILTIIAILSFLGNSSFIILLPTMSELPNFIYQGVEYKVREDNSIRNSFCLNNTLTDSNTISIDMLKDIVFIDNYPVTWASELGLICNSDAVFKIISTIYFLASLASNIAFDSFPDRYGRKNIFILLNIFSLIALIQLLYLSSVIQLIIAAFFMGFATFNLGLISTIITENFNYKQAGVAFTFANSMFAFSGLMTAVIMYYLQDWHIQHSLILMLFFTGNLLSLIYLSESPKWLAANFHFEKLKESLINISTINGTESKIKQMLTEKYVNFETGKNRKKSSSVKDRKISNQLSKLKQKYLHDNTNEIINLNINSSNNIRNSNGNIHDNPYQTNINGMNVESYSNAINNRTRIDSNNKNNISKESAIHKYSLPLNMLEDNSGFIKRKQLYSEENKQTTENDIKKQYSIAASETSSYDQLKKDGFEEEENTIEQASVQLFKIKNYTRFDLLFFSSTKDLTVKNLFLWGVVGFTFFGVFLNLNLFGTNIYLTAIISFSAQLVGLLFSAFYNLFFTRREVVFYSFFFSGLFTFFYNVTTSPTVLLYCLFFSVASLSSASNLIYLYSAECYPINARVTALNFFILSERIFALVISFMLVYISDLFWLSSIFCLFSAILVWSLPDSESIDTGDELPEFENKAFKFVENEIEKNCDNNTLFKKYKKFSY
jgi:MFS family permease